MQVSRIALGLAVAAAPGRRAGRDAVGRTGAAGQRARHRQAGHRRHRRGHRHRDLDQRQLLRAARRGVRPRRAATLNIAGGHADHRRVGQRRHADRRARRPAERHRHRDRADRLHQRPADRPARPRRLGRPHHQRPRAGQLRQAARRAGEGDTGVYGGTDDNDNSGILRYVRVEFSGVEFSPDNELNGIAFQGVGRGTQVDHVQAHMSRDDAMEWFGGTVDGKYVVMSNAADDSFDWTFGWTGPRAVRRRHPARRRCRQRHRGGQQRVQQQRAAALESADLQHHDVRRSRPQRGRRESARREPAPRHGVHDPQLPDHRLQDRRASRSRRRTRRRPARSTTARRRWAPAWSGTSPTPHARQRARPTSTAAASRTSAPNVDPGVSTAACSNHEAPNFQPSGDRHAGRRAAGADSAAERRLLRGRDLHRRRAAGARRRTGWTAGRRFRRTDRGLGCYDGPDVTVRPVVTVPPGKPVLTCLDHPDRPHGSSRMVLVRRWRRAAALRDRHSLTHKSSSSALASAVLDAIEA